MEDEVKRTIIHWDSNLTPPADNSFHDSYEEFPRVPVDYRKYSLISLPEDESRTIRGESIDIPPPSNQFAERLPSLEHSSPIAKSPSPSFLIHYHYRKGSVGTTEFVDRPPLVNPENSTSLSDERDRRQHVAVGLPSGVDRTSRNGSTKTPKTVRSQNVSSGDNSIDRNKPKVELSSLGKVIVLDMDHQARVMGNGVYQDNQHPPLVPMKAKTKRALLLCIAVAICIAGAILISLHLMGII